MANYDFFALGETSVTISGGGQLDGVTQGDGSHLVGRTITLNSTNFEELSVRDGGGASDRFFDDNDRDQRLRGTQDFDGVRYSNNSVIEAEYIITMRDPTTGIEYEAVAVNVNNSSPSFATVEGLAFIDVIPPAGVPLTVIRATEGPGFQGIPSLEAGDIAAPACFTPGTLILTPQGERPVETLRVGDLVTTVDNGDQPLRWIGSSHVGTFRMALNPAFRPVRIRAHALGHNQPARDMLVSAQHRVLLEGWQAELLYGDVHVLAAAKHLVDDNKVMRAWDMAEVTYLHLQFDNHELVYSDGLRTESFNPGPQSIGAIPDAARAELQALFPDRDLSLEVPNSAARAMINRREARALRAVA